ncbi:CrtD protein [Skermanella stibiiresistens SB22]|uniref:CrtD protein n=1 Tax=Skermanella stibiiresistens SB22 TaxID=1385369 RepID=W9H467_9PROT|nr:1-hydroxycarotenoid 3,4-desaturase CrtD [Skermanella stibiiresistens]EWY39512.1 CrtD protein [Skermanella stibiiresistens SB22]
MGQKRVIVVGAGIAGLTAALSLANRGLGVTVVERADRPGGKMREIEVGGAKLDAGPTVFTLRRIFDDIFAEAGTDLDHHVTLRPAGVLARHAWTDGSRLDLFADRERSADAIGAFAGAREADGFRRFQAEAARTWRTLESSFIRSAEPSVGGLVGAVGLRGLGDLWRIRPFETLWKALGDYFKDPRLRQLFGRYATYCGSSPFLAPATLMLVAHVEQEGVWLVDGGMARLAEALAGLAAERGAVFRYGAEVRSVEVTGGRASGVTLASGERIEADAVVVNADPAALASGMLGRTAAGAVPKIDPNARSLSAITWSLLAEAEGFPLARHTVFFSDDYAAEFADILDRSRPPRSPTVYVCAQDRDDDGTAPGGPERLFCLINAPAIGDTHPFDATEIDQCATRTFGILERCGLRVTTRPDRMVAASPRDWNRLFPATGGALYGPASHGWKTSFSRPTARSRIPGLYLAGGGIHPGPGVPMVALSGRMAAEAVTRDLAPGLASPLTGSRRSGSTAPSPKTATPGGMSTP